MAGRLQGKIAIVMGAGTGMGEAVAHKFAREGAMVCAFGRPDDPIDEVVAAINEQYGDVAIGATGDGADGQAMQAAVAQTVARFGRLDIACQTAGSFGPIADLVDYDLAIFDQLLNNNCRALFVFTRTVLPHLRETHGSVVTIGSAAAVVGEPAAVPYGATKAFIHAFTVGLAAEESPNGVRVNSVAPGVIDTGWFDPERGPLEPEMLKRLPGTNLMGSLGTPEEIANVVAFLASEEASYVTGSIWAADGGLPITRGAAGEKASPSFRSAPAGELTLRHSHDGSGKVAQQARQGGQTMKKRTLGRSGIEVSEVALGSWLTFAGGIERDVTGDCTRTAIDLGITFFDTANVYGQGVAESAWGDILSAYKRVDYVLATKVWGKMPDGQGLAPEQITHQLDYVG